MRRKDQILDAMYDSNGNYLGDNSWDKLLVEVLVDIRDLLANPIMISQDKRGGAGSVGNNKPL